MFVYELPYASRKSLCQILDTNDKWEELGGSHMGFDYTYLQYLRRRDSPTDELLTTWGNQNHTVNDLFVLLSKMQHYRAMNLLKEYVEKKFYHLLPEGEELMMSRPLPFKNHFPSQGIVNGGNQQSYVALEPTIAGVRPFSVVSPPHSIEDNKDLGLEQFNLNHEIPTMKVSRKAVNEVKIQNIGGNTRNGKEKENINRQGMSSNGLYLQVAGRPNPNQPLLHLSQPPIQKAAIRRKVSTSSVSSSMMESPMPQIDYGELVAATNGWDESCILGKGGFGVVYKGTWKNTLVAIKKLEAKVKNQEDLTNQLVRELKSLNSHRHDNILSLYAYSINDSVACLVYQYMANGSLDDRLLCRQKSVPLDWFQRLKIMRGTARGIQFLHSLGSPPLVHGDIKSANILLDANFEPRIGDFGLAREGPLQQYTHVKVTRIHGTKPYLPDEFLRGHEFSVKVDTYSFGVVLFEVATGLRAYDEKRKEKFLKDHIESYPMTELHKLADKLAGVDLCATATGLLTLGLNCVKARRHDRPDMSTVYKDVTKLYDNFEGALRAIIMAQQRSQAPSSPLEIQAAFDAQHNPSQTQQPTIPQGSVQNGTDMYQLPRDQVSPEIVLSPPQISDSSLPLVTLLNNKPGSMCSNQQSSVLSTTSYQDTTSSESEQVSNEPKSTSDNACLPIITELQGLRLAGVSASTST